MILCAAAEGEVQLKLQMGLTGCSPDSLDTSYRFVCPSVFFRCRKQLNSVLSPESQAAHSGSIQTPDWV